MRVIPYSRQTITGEDIRSVTRVLGSDWLTQGPTVGRFEKALSRYTGARYAVAFSSGTAALQAAYFAAGVGKGDEVITSPLTFASTANAARWQGARVVFSDIEDTTGALDPRLVESRITKHTRVITAIDYAGIPADLGALRRVAGRHRVLLIEDASHALGATYQGKRVGSIADLTTFSFHPVKSITTGEGGAVTVNRKDWYLRLLLFRNHGITKDPKKFLKKSPGDWYYEMQALGQNFRLTDIQAALGISQLKKLPGFLKTRKEIARRYQDAFASAEGLILPREPRGRISAWHLYPIRLHTSLISRRGEIFRKMKQARIGVQVHYIPVYRHPYYQNMGYRRGLCPRAEKFYTAVISLPIFPGLMRSEQEYVIQTFRKIVESAANF